MTRVSGEKRMRAVTAAGVSPSWEEDALGFLIAPVDRETFLASHYEQSALINNRGEPDRYRDLLSLDALDHFIASGYLWSSFDKFEPPTDARMAWKKFCELCAVLGDPFSGGIGLWSIDQRLRECA